MKRVMANEMTDAFEHASFVLGMDDTFSSTFSWLGLRHVDTAYICPSPIISIYQINRLPVESRSAEFAKPAF